MCRGYMLASNLVVPVPKPDTVDADGTIMHFADVLGIDTIGFLTQGDDPRAPVWVWLLDEPMGSNALAASWQITLRERWA